MNQTNVERVFLGLSLVLNFVLLGGLLFSPRFGLLRAPHHPTSSESRRIATLPCVQVSDRSPALDQSKLPSNFTPVSLSPLSKGLSVGPYPVTLGDVLVSIPSQTARDSVSRMWDAWGDLLSVTDSLELVIDNNNNGGGGGGVGASWFQGGGGGGDETGANDDDDLRPVQISESESISTKNSHADVRVVGWHNRLKDKGVDMSNMLKHWTWIARGLSGNNHSNHHHQQLQQQQQQKQERFSFYERRNWFVRADASTFVLPRHLLAMLSQFDPKKPVLLLSGSMYVLSKSALQQFGDISSKRLSGSVAMKESGDDEDKVVVRWMKEIGVAATNAERFGIWEERMWSRRDRKDLPLVALQNMDDLCMLDLRALANIEWEFASFAP